MSWLLWLKALHVVAVISWMAGLLYLPRLMVYHCDSGRGSVQSETFKVMERRLLRAIMNPAMIVVWITGPWLAWQMGYLNDHWFWAKFALVCALTGFHHVLVRRMKDFAADENTRSAKYYKIINEVPTVLMIGIVIFVIVRPI
jgi:protoporphyrinogen IX oxidase